MNFNRNTKLITLKNYIRENNIDVAGDRRKKESYLNAINQHTQRQEEERRRQENINEIRKLNEANRARELEMKGPLGKLRRQRVIKENIFFQNTFIKSHDEFNDIIVKSDVVYLNHNILNQIREATNILASATFLSLKLKIAYSYIESDGKVSYPRFCGNPINFDLASELHDNNGQISPIERVKELTLELIQKTKLINFTVVNMRDPREINNISDIARKISSEFSSITIVFCITGYSILSGSESGFSILNYAQRLRAFNPIPNQEYHRLTACSTTKDRLCIWQTYYYLYVEEIFICKNEKKIEDKLKEECKEVINYIKNGELLNFLLFKSKELNEEMYVEFFKNNILGFIVHPDGNVTEIKDESVLINKKVFLYDKEHVAPRKNITANIKFEKMQKSILNNYKKNVEKAIEEGDDEKIERNEKTLKNAINLTGLTEYKIIEDENGQEITLRPNKYCQNEKNKEEIIDDIHKKIINNRKNNFTLTKKTIKNIKNNIEKIIGYDFENLLDEDYESTPFCLCLSNGKNFYGNDDIIDNFIDYLDTLKTEVDTTKTHKKEEVKQILIYGFNNSRFDNIFIFNKLLTRNPACKYIIMDTSIKYIKYHNIRIYDLSLYYSGSLDYVAKSFKLSINKGVFPYHFPNKNNLNYIGKVPELKYWKCKEDRDEYINKNGDSFNLKEYTIKYCELDAKLAEEIAIKHLIECIGVIHDEKCKFKNSISDYDTLNEKIDKINSISCKCNRYDTRLTSTGAGIALKMFNQIFQGETLYESPIKQQEKERKAYKGGRTEVFKKMFNFKYNIRKYQKLKYFDINSSYPYAMTYEMPYKFKQCLAINERIVNKDNLKPHFLYHAKSEYKGNNKHFIPNLLVRSDKGDIIATKNTKFSYHWGIELIEAIDNHCEITIDEINEYEGKKLFKTYSEYLYGERLKVKKLNPAKANFFKLCLNSLYGKFGQNIKTNNKLCSFKEEIDQILTNVNIKVVDYEVVGEKILIKYNNKDDEHNSIGNLVRFASYIAAIARSNLSIFMRAVGHENVYYCDTDSVFTDVDPPSEMLDQNILGKWKQEGGDIDEAYFIAPKSYYFIESNNEEHKKAKGLPNYLMNKEHYINAMSECKFLLPEIENPSMFFRRLDGVKIKPQIRTLQTVYNKRLWDDNVSYPYESFESWYNNKYLMF